MGTILLYQNMPKRLIDVTASCALLLCISPLILIIVTLLLLLQGRPVFFKQQRIGRHEIPFNILKFRTMTVTADMRASSDTDRLTGIGRFLRKTSLDELPNLLNVISGEMSLIGPRPLLSEYLPYYTARERIRFTIRPGLTGLAQTSGRNFLSWDERLELDAVYTNSLSAKQDAIIFINTVSQVIRRKNVSEDTSATETYLDEERQIVDE